MTLKGGNVQLVRSAVSHEAPSGPTSGWGTNSIGGFRGQIFPQPPDFDDGAVAWPGGSGSMYDKGFHNETTWETTPSARPQDMTDAFVLTRIGTNTTPDLTPRRILSNDSSNGDFLVESPFPVYNATTEWWLGPKHWLFPLVTAQQCVDGLTDYRMVWVQNQTAVSPLFRYQTWIATQQAPGGIYFEVFGQSSNSASQADMVSYGHQRLADEFGVPQLPYGPDYDDFRLSRWDRADSHLFQHPNIPTNHQLISNQAVAIWIKRVIPPGTPRGLCGAALGVSVTNTGTASQDPDPFVTHYPFAFEVQGFTPKLVTKFDRRLKIGGGAILGTTLTSEESPTTPVEGIPVRFSHTGPGAIADDPNQVTDANGFASVTFNCSADPADEGQSVVGRAQVL